jgi:hypothetical protein
MWFTRPTKPEPTPREQELAQPPRVGQMGDDPAAVSEARLHDEAVGTLEETGFAKWSGNRQ